MKCKDMDFRTKLKILELLHVFYPEKNGTFATNSTKNNNL